MKFENPDVFNIKSEKMRKYLLSIILFSFAATSFCTTWVITNTGSTFTPATITITFGDNVNFTIDGSHAVLEVSQTTWNANGNTALAGGFSTPFGGGLVPSSQLAVGTHYYVCQAHYASGMKGIIIVQSATGIKENQSLPGLSVYPNPSNNLLTIKTSDNLIGLEYFIIDQVGRQVLNGKLVNETGQIDISRLSSGIYVVQLSGQRKQSFKVIKK